MSQVTSKLSLYDFDPYLWLEDTIARLKVSNFHELDRTHLIEELEMMAGRDRAEIECRLGVLLAYLLRWLYVNHTYDYQRWETTIREQRRHLRIALEQSPSLEHFFVSVFDRAWQDALEEVREIYPQVTFPVEWKFSRDVDILLTEKFWD